MRKSYFDLVRETFDFPQDRFSVSEDRLYFQGIDLCALVEQQGSPLRITYLPAIGEQIDKARRWFGDAISHHNYQGSYYFSYCTKSNHFRFTLEEVLKKGARLELSSAFDVDIVDRLHAEGKVPDDCYIVCNGFKTANYSRRIAEMNRKLPFGQMVPVLDGVREAEILESLDEPIRYGIRVAALEEPSYEFYTSRLGIRADRVEKFYEQRLAPLERHEFHMLHFFIDSGIKDAGFYWIELEKAVELWCRLRKKCDSLKSLNIGGGLPSKNSLGFEFDYAYMIDEIVSRIKTICDEHGVPHPDIFTEFGKFTVAASGIQVFSILGQKQQNDNERWYMLDNSLLTTMPDIWGIQQRFIMLPLNLWNNAYQRINIGGLSCDIDDYYNAEAHVNQVYLPQIGEGEKLYIGFFNMGAYQESLSGYGGTKHCLIPSPKHVLLDGNGDGFSCRVFRESQTSEAMLSILGY